MPRFLKETDYDPFIKAEIKKSITGTLLPNNVSIKQLAAEETATAMIREYIGGRYNCDLVFAAVDSARNMFIVKCVIVITLYSLYHQTGMKDIPEHRQNDYDDTVKWLEKVGQGSIPTSLPPKLTETGNYEGDIRINSRKPQDHKW
ncbi:MAG: DUF1320 domain-containing protein [Sphingobacteriia bacterium]|nr:MAG: DUF1320 domain-containing protein [Sphingobacteriia bacterium]